MICAHCSSPVPKTAKFCHNCGSQVSDAEGQARASAEMDDSSFAHMEELLRGDTEGEFKIERMLGRGGMAVVYLATEIHLSRKVAIKVLPPELTFGHGVERFKREAKTAAALDHPNIIPIYRVASGGKIFWYAMKYLEGRALDELLKEKQRFTLEETIHILAQVSDALDYAHEHQVIHRDVKPANVMLDSRNRVVVTDFGIAKALTEGTLTASGSVVGTPYYMSPEQGMGKGITGGADQYSVGVMAYRMLSGQVPFEGDSAIDILHKHCMVPPAPLAVIQPQLPQHVYWAVHKALEKTARKRFASVTAFVDALKHPTPEAEASAESSEAATLMVERRTPPTTPVPEHADTPPTPPPMPSPPRKRGRKVAGAVLGVLAFATGVAGAWWFSVQGDTAPQEITLIDDTAQVATPGGEQLAAAGATPAADTATTPPDTTTPPPTPPPPTTGRVTVSGLPSGGVVYAGGRRQRGTNFELPAGRHVLRMEVGGYERVEQAITVVAGERLSVQYTGRRIQRQTPPPQAQRPPPAQTPAPRMGVLQLLIRPPANVFIDGVAKGERTRLADTLLAGRHLLRFMRDGFVTKDTTVTVTAGQLLRLRIQMRQSP